MLRAKLTVQDFIKGLHNRTVLFDKLCILITCRTFNVHCVVLLDGAYWSTHPNNDLHDCLNKIAYVGDFGFKEVQTEVYQSLNNEASKEYVSEPELSCSDDDLQGTGLNADGKTSTEACDSEDMSSQQENLQSQNGTTEQDTLDVKPLVTSIEKNAIVISDDEEEPKDVKPFIKAHVKVTVDASDAIVISDDETLNSQINLYLHCLLFQFQLPKKVKYHHIKHDCNYSCYLCDETFEMQSSFVTNFRATHPNDLLKCDFCASTFQSSNGLFKHEWSHLYMKYKCDICSRLFQFPYQL